MCKKLKSAKCSTIYYKIIFSNQLFYYFHPVLKGQNGLSHTTAEAGFLKQSLSGKILLVSNSSRKNLYSF